MIPASRPSTHPAEVYARAVDGATVALADCLHLLRHLDPLEVHHHGPALAELCDEVAQLADAIVAATPLPARRPTVDTAPL